MPNIYIGTPLDALRNYCDRKEYRSIATMTKEECALILNLALDNGDWIGASVNHIQISSSHSNFVEGNISLGGGDTYYFSIRYDGTVSVHKMEFDEKKMEFVHTKKILPIYRFSDIIYIMIRMGFDLITHLE